MRTTFVSHSQGGKTLINLISLLCRFFCNHSRLTVDIACDTSAPMHSLTRKRCPKRFCFFFELVECWKDCVDNTVLLPNCTTHVESCSSGTDFTASTTA